MTSTKKTALRVLMTLALVLGTFTFTTPQADATPIDHLVDCDDIFWAIACEVDPGVPVDQVLGITVTAADVGFSCAPTASGFVICHS